jgi:hypothetical protein
MPKKGGKGKKSSQKRPEWMSEELFALSQNPTQLIDNFRGASEKNTVPVTIPKDQVNFKKWKVRNLLKWLLVDWLWQPSLPISGRANF